MNFFSLLQVYIKKGRASECICSLPNGIAMYQQCLNFHLSCRMSPKEVHELGLEEVARIQRQMKLVAKKEGYDHVFPYIKKLKTKEGSKFASGVSGVCGVGERFLLLLSLWGEGIQVCCHFG